jgi:predicted transcriptional regulator
MAFHIKQLFPGQTGSRAALHDLEAAVMDVVWTEPSEEFSVRTVVSGLRPERDLAYTTMDRSAKRELLLRRKEARA